MLQKGGRPLTLTFRCKFSFFDLEDSDEEDEEELELRARRAEAGDDEPEGQVSGTCPPTSCAGLVCSTWPMVSTPLKTLCPGTSAHI